MKFAYVNISSNVLFSTNIEELETIPTHLKEFYSYKINSMYVMIYDFDMKHYSSELIVLLDNNPNSVRQFENSVKKLLNSDIVLSYIPWLEKGIIASELYKFNNLVLAEEIFNKNFAEPKYSEKLENKRISLNISIKPIGPAYEKIIKDILTFNYNDYNNHNDDNLQSTQSTQSINLTNLEIENNKMILGHNKFFDRSVKKFLSLIKK